MKPFVNFIPTKLYFGAGQLGMLGTIPLPGKKALIVITSGKSMRSSGTLDRVEKLLAHNNVGCAVYDKVVAMDVSELEPMVTFGYKPDQVKTVREMEGTPVNQIYIGSCTNGRLEDLRIAAGILKGKKISENVRAIVSPATPKIYREALKEGLIEIFMEAGFCVTNPTCGACLGMSNGVLANGESCASTTTARAATVRSSTGWAKSISSRTNRWPPTCASWKTWARMRTITPASGTIRTARPNPGSGFTYTPISRSG